MLVLDNATETVQSIARLLPTPPEWHVLVTSYRAHALIQYSHCLYSVTISLDFQYPYTGVIKEINNSLGLFLQ